MTLNRKVWLIVSLTLTLCCVTAEALFVRFTTSEVLSYFDKELIKLRAMWEARLDAVEETARSASQLIEKDDLTRRYFFYRDGSADINLYTSFTAFLADLLQVFPDLGEISLVMPSGEEEIRIAFGVPNNNFQLDSLAFRQFIGSDATELTTIEYHEDFEQASLVYYRKLNLKGYPLSQNETHSSPKSVLRISAPLSRVFHSKEYVSQVYQRPMLVDQARHIVYPGDSLELAVKALSFLDQSWNNKLVGREWYLSRQEWKNGLSMIAILDVSHFITKVTTSLYQFTAALVFLALILLFSINLVLRKVVISPLESLADFARGGERKISPRWFGRQDEIGQLIQAVTSMRQGLMQKNLDLSSQVFKDTLTGLPNRNALPRLLELQSVEADQKNTDFALLFLDLDGFKQVNDAYGHAAGDTLLVKVAERISSQLRTNDSVLLLAEGGLQEGPSLVRLGGDEFTVVLPTIRGRDNALEVANRLVNGFEQPFAIDDVEVYVGGSIGISLYPTDTTNLDELIKFADTAMYEAKARGKMQAVVYEPWMVEAEENVLQVKHIIRHALDNDEIETWFQPKVDPVRHKVMGFEALVRINSVKFGFLSPDVFIGIAEQTNLIDQVTLRCLESMCRLFLKLREVCHQDFVMSFNVSPKQIGNDNLFAKMATIINAYGVPHGCIDFEFVETSLMQNEELGRKRLDELHREGFRTSLDDFGVGYSSLSYLKVFSFDTLKIDRTFFSDVAEDHSSKMILQSIVGMARNLKMTVVAEGIETADQLQFVLDHQVDLVQGYLYSRPLHEDDVSGYLHLFDVTRRVRMTEQGKSV